VSSNIRFWFTENTILPLSDIIKKQDVNKWYRFFRQTLEWSKDKIEEIQLKKVQNLLSYAYKNVPYYTRLFNDNNINPEKITSISDLQLIPPLTRAGLQENCYKILSSNISVNKLNKGSSSGSTGIPVFYFKDARAISAGKSAGMLGWNLSGWKMGMKGLHIWGNPTTVNNEWRRPGSKINALLFNHHKFPAYKLNDENEFDSLTKLILRKQYEFIDGYTNAIYLLSKHLQENEIHFYRKLKLVLTTAENLQEFQRDSINDSIGPGVDGYGCGEINGIAYECKECGFYHTIDPHVIVEYGDIVDENGSQELLITDLDNFVFPLIRYKNGDAGIPLSENPNDCRIKFKRLQKISGRQSDIIILPKGGTLSVPSFFGSMLLKKVKGIKQYQIIWEEKDLLTILLVRLRNFSEEDNIIINNSLSEYLDGKIRYRIKYVEKINTSQTGKHKLLIDKTTC